MRLNAKPLAAPCLALGLCLVALGFTYAMSGPSYPTLCAPDAVHSGDSLVMEATSDVGGLRIVITDANGLVLYDSDEDPGAQEQTSPDGSGMTTLTAGFTVPADAAGPLTVTASDGCGGTTTKSVAVTS
jgi:hypothetical protein